MIPLNQRAWKRCQRLPEQAEVLGVQLAESVGKGQVWDFGNAAPGGLSAGVELARICMSDLADIRLVPWGDATFSGTGFAVQVSTDHPYSACMKSQYAGWRLAEGKFFAMGSGPMRAAAAKEELFGGQDPEKTSVAVGVLETNDLPPDAILQKIATDCGVSSEAVCLLVARTASVAGTVQIVARSVETAMHKLMDLGFDLSTVLSGAGVAPLPPIAKDDMTGIGWTNDAILYGAQVTLWVRSTDECLEELVAKVPSCHSRDYGQPFGKIFANYDYDFYKIDPHLFSPASIRLVNLATGHIFSAGTPNLEILQQSFWRDETSGADQSPE